MMSSQEEKTWGMLAHLIPLLITFLTGGFGWIGALVIYLAYKDRSRFVAFHALQELYLTIAIFVTGVIGVVLFFTVIGIPIALILWIAAYLAGIVLPILGAIKANAHEWYEYPVIGKLAKQSVGA